MQNNFILVITVHSNSGLADAIQDERGPVQQTFIY